MNVSRSEVPAVPALHVQNTAAEPAAVEAPQSDYRRVFSRPDLRAEFAKFLRNIFMRLDERQFFALIDSVMTGATSDEEIYRALAGRIGEAKGNKFSDLRQSLRSLKVNTVVTAAQVAHLMGETREVDGYVEIGYPGRFIRPLQGKLNIKGRITVVNTSEQMSDYLQSGIGPRPYHQFVPLNDYRPLTESRLTRSSVDLVTCFIGLHHVPEDKLQGFVQSIHQILRPGGSFLLRDHDARNEDLRAVANVVHSVFNAATGVSAEEERMEVRRFKDLNYWISFLEANGFRRETRDPLVQEGDPTENAMVRFVKVPTLQESQAGAARTMLRDSNEYRRELLQTFLTTPEWHNVDVAQEYGRFIEHTPFYSFPFFKHIALFWQVYRKAWNAAREHHSLREVLFSEYTLMNAFIGSTMTVEFLAKGILSAPIACFYGAPGRKEVETIQLLVDDQNNEVSTVDERIKIIKNLEGTKFKLITLPRYRPFTEMIRKLSRTGVQTIEIAGQQKIQVKVRIPADNLAVAQGIRGSKQLYTWPILSDESHHYAALEVDVQSLGSVIRALEERGADISYVHDF